MESHLVLMLKKNRWLFRILGVHLLRVMGIDPGLAMTGFGVVDGLPRGGKACDWGTIRTEPGGSISLRLKTIYDELKSLLEVWRPDFLVLEDVFVLKQFPKAAIQLGEVRGVICLAAQERGISVLHVKATEVKSAITGSGRAEKRQIQRMIQRILRLEKPLSSSHAADALALALTGLSRNGNFRW